MKISPETILTLLVALVILSIYHKSKINKENKFDLLVKIFSSLPDTHKAKINCVSGPGYLVLFGEELDDVYSEIEAVIRQQLEYNLTDCKIQKNEVRFVVQDTKTKKKIELNLLQKLSGQDQKAFILYCS